MSDEVNIDLVNQSKSDDIDRVFDSLSQNIESVNNFLNNLNNQKKANQEVVGVIEEERKRLEEEKSNFESNMSFQTKELEARKNQIEKYFALQKDALKLAEEEFKRNMDVALSEFDIIRQEAELEKQNIAKERSQFEEYKKIELERIRHSEEVLSSEKSQFEKYKEVTTKKIELENKNLEQKCNKLKDIVSKFNVSFKPLKEEE